MGQRTFYVFALENHLLHSPNRKVTGAAFFVPVFGQPALFVRGRLRGVGGADTGVVPLLAVWGQTS